VFENIMVFAMKKGKGEMVGKREREGKELGKSFLTENTFFLCLLIGNRGAKEKR